MAAAAIIAGVAMSCGQAAAQQNIGSAALARNNVTRELGGARAALGVGDSVFLNEVVQTAAESTAKLVFLDSTNLAIGPIARVVLDKYVYKGAEGSQALVVELAKGLFRFTTGSLDKSAYTIETPTAAVGVRGTVLDIAVAGARTRVTLREGRAVVCARKNGETLQQLERECVVSPGHCSCVDLTHAGQTVAVAPAGAGVRASLTSNAVQFASLCTGGSGLCGVSPSLANAGSPAPVEAGDLGPAGPTLSDAGGGAALCGR